VYSSRRETGSCAEHESKYFNYFYFPLSLPNPYGGGMGYFFLVVVRYIKMLLLSLIFLLLANAVTKRREKSILFNRVAIIILLYSSIVGYDSLAITSLGRGISIYGGLFLLQLRLIINYIKQLFKIGFSDYILIHPVPTIPLWLGGLPIWGGTNFLYNYRSIR
jgi:hypothetical protein